MSIIHLSDSDFDVSLFLRSIFCVTILSVARLGCFGKGVHAQWAVCIRHAFLTFQTKIWLYFGKLGAKRYLHFLAYETTSM